MNKWKVIVVHTQRMPLKIKKAALPSLKAASRWQQVKEKKRKVVKALSSRQKPVWLSPQSLKVKLTQRPQERMEVSRV